MQVRASLNGIGEGGGEAETTEEALGSATHHGTRRSWRLRPADAGAPRAGE